MFAHIMSDFEIWGILGMIMLFISFIVAAIVLGSPKKKNQK